MKNEFILFLERRIFYLKFIHEIFFIFLFIFVAIHLFSSDEKHFFAGALFGYDNGVMWVSFFSCSRYECFVIHTKREVWKEREEGM